MSPEPRADPRRWIVPAPLQTDRRGFLRLTGAAGLLGVVGPAGGRAGCSTGNAAPGANGATSTTAPGGGVHIHEYVPGPQPVSGGRYGGTVNVVWADPPNSLDPAGGDNLTARERIHQGC